MRCQKVRKKLSAFIDNELDGAMRVKLEEHLRECFSCRQELRLLSQTWEVLGIWEKIEPSDNFEAKFWQRVKEKVKERELKPRARLFQWLTKIAVPSSAIALIFLALGLLCGIYLGDMLYPEENRVLPENSLSLIKENLLFLESFEDFPRESVANIYISLASSEVLKRNKQ